MRGARRHAKEEGGLTAAHRDGEVENDCTPGVLHEHWSNCAQAAIADYVGDIIHTVTNPLDRLTGAIHVYGGDFFATPRSEWDPETLVEAPFDVQTTMRLFEEANAAYEARMRAS